jgi:hypothetical protein
MNPTLLLKPEDCVADHPNIEPLRIMGAYQFKDGF